MRAIPRALTATLAGTLLVLLSSPVGAQEGGEVPAPRAEAQATALRMSLFGQEVVVSAADAAADAGPTGTAQGSGAFLATTGFGQSEAVADASTPTSGSTEPTCSDLTLPPEVPLPVGAITACSTAQATAAEGQGSATATGLAADIDAGSSADLEELGLPIDELDESLIDPLLELIGEVPLPGELAQIDILLDTLLDNPLTLATIQAGATEATSTASASTASATATSEGLRIDLLDSSVLGPLATIVVGQSTATATFEGGAATAAHVVAPVTVELGIALATALGTSEIEIPVPEGQVIDLPLPPPLQSRITVSGGTDTRDGVNASSTADAVRLDLFTGLTGGGVVIAASDTAAAVEGVAVQDSPPVEPAGPPTEVRPSGPTERGALPRTGGDGRWVPVGVLMAVAAGVALVTLRRSRTAPEA